MPGSGTAYANPISKRVAVSSARSKCASSVSPAFQPMPRSISVPVKNAITSSTVDDFVFDRSLGRPRNAVVLPSGWYCTFSAIPASISQLPDGRIRLDYWNGRPEPLNVLLKARRRAQ